VAQAEIEKCFPGGTSRNWNSYGHKIGPLTDEQKYILADPQTSGGLLVAVESDACNEFENFMLQQGKPIQAIGWLENKKKHIVTLL